MEVEIEPSMTRFTKGILTPPPLISTTLTSSLVKASPASLNKESNRDLSSAATSLEDSSSVDCESDILASISPGRFSSTMLVSPIVDKISLALLHCRARENQL